jgi:hypothetical protein
VSTFPTDWREQTTHDGRVTLRLPPDWGTAFEEATGTTYFGLDDEDKGLLRVTPLVFSKEDEIRADELPNLFSRSARHAQVQKLTATRCFVEYAQEGEEDGEPLIQRYWETVQQVDAHRVVLVIASYTLGTAETPLSESSLLTALGASFQTATIRESRAG